MTREDLVALVDRAFATFNIDPTKPQRAAAYQAWWPLLHDLDATATNKALTRIAVTGERFMPRPGEIRRAVLAPTDAPPNPLEAWAQFQARLRAAHSGLAPTPVHDLVLTTMTRIGGGAGMHTNGDRDVFCSLYAQVLADWESRHYEVPDES